MSKWPFGGKEDKGEGGNEAEEKQINTLLEKFSAAIDEKLTPLRTQVETLTGKFTKIEEEAGAEAAAAEARRRAEANENLTPEEKQANREKAILLVAGQANARVTESEAVAELAQTYPNLVPKLKEMFAKTSIEVKAQGNYAELVHNAMDILVGRAAREGGLKFNKNTEKFVLEDGQGGSTGAVSPLTNGDYDWTDDRSGRSYSGKQQLSKMKLSEKDLKEMQDNGFIQ